MNIRRASKDEKRYMVMAAILALHRKEYEVMGIYNWVNASQIARQIGYKSGNSIREALYSLVDEGRIEMFVSPTITNSAVNAPVWFRATLEPYKRVQSGKGLKK